jgi:hypothetical protein
MKANELRIGNLLNYQTAEGDILTATIDWQDLKWLSEDEQGFNLVHNPILLTEDWLLKFGFKLVFAGQGDGFIYECGQLCNAMNIYSRNRNVFLYSTFNSCEINIKYVHQLQNLYFALTGEELSL